MGHTAGEHSHDHRAGVSTLGGATVSARLGLKDIEVEGLPVDTSGDLPLDFLTYLGRRLDVNREAAIAMLGEWLTRYIGERPLDGGKREQSSGGDAVSPG